MSHKYTNTLTGFIILSHWELWFSVADTASQKKKKKKKMEKLSNPEKVME